MHIFFQSSIFRLFSVIKLSIEFNKALEKLFLSACRCWDACNLVGEMDQKVELGGIIGYGVSNSEFIFCHSKYLDYMQN